MFTGIIEDQGIVKTFKKLKDYRLVVSSKNKFNKHWHTHGDDLNNISKKTLKAIGQTVMHVIYND